MKGRAWFSANREEPGIDGNVGIVICRHTHPSSPEREGKSTVLSPEEG